jgi:hypothetical protein
VNPALERDRTDAKTGVFFMTYLLFLCLALLSSALVYLNFTTLLAAGTLISAGLAVALSCAVPGCLLTMNEWVLCALLGLLVSAHLLIASLIVQADVPRGVLSIAALVLCLAGAACTAKILRKNTPENLVRILSGVTLVLLSCGLLGGFHLFQPASMTVSLKPVFPFTEPAELANVLGPFLIFACVYASGMKRLLYIGLAILTALTLQNLTLAVLCLIVALACLRFRHALFLCGALILAGFFASFDASYYLERLNFSGDTKNISSLVYIQGWQLLAESLKASHGFGLGFQQLGIFGTDVGASKVLFTLLRGNQNILTGGFALSKIVSEFGVFGAALVGVYLCLAGRSFMLIRKAAAGAGADASHPAGIFAASVLLGYLVDLLVRGGGYFVTSSFLAMTALFLWFGPGAAR